jgi:multidrug efflux system membrane fusion protein
VKVRSVLLFLSVMGVAALSNDVVRGWLASALTGATGSAVESRASSPAGVPATVIRADTRDVPVWLWGIGSIVPLSSVTVKSRVDGKLDRVTFTEGQEVHAGDVLAQIDPRQFRAALDQAMAKQTQDEATLANAKIDMARYNKLVLNSYATAQQADTQKTTVAQLEAQVRQDQAAVAMAQLQLDFTTITAPADGRAGLRFVDPGSIIHVIDQNGIVTITQLEPITVIFAVSQDQLPEIRSAMSRGEVAVSVYTRDGSQRLADGKLEFVDSQVDQTTGQIRLKALFRNADRVLWPGQFVNARLLLKTLTGVTVVPTNAIERGQAGPYVFRVGPGDIVEARPISLGPVSGGITVITAGLESGDQVVVGGQYRLRPGMRIEARAATDSPRP